jgi:hypothetical protein
MIVEWSPPPSWQQIADDRWACANASLTVGRPVPVPPDPEAAVVRLLHRGLTAGALVRVIADARVQPAELAMRVIDALIELDGAPVATRLAAFLVAGERVAVVVVDARGELCERDALVAALARARFAWPPEPWLLSELLDGFGPAPSISDAFSYHAG